MKTILDQHRKAAIFQQHLEAIADSSLNEHKAKACEKITLDERERFAIGYAEWIRENTVKVTGSKQLFYIPDDFYKTDKELIALYKTHLQSQAVTPSHL